MKKAFLISFYIVIAHVAVAQSQQSPNYVKLVSKADSLFKIRLYSDAAKTYSAAFEVNGWKGAIEDRIKAARCWSMAGVPDSAFFNLYRIATKTAFSNYKRLADEPDLVTLQSDARWLPLVERVKANNALGNWRKAGSKPDSYDVSLDSTLNKKDKVWTIRSKENKIDGFATAMKTINAHEYIGKRVRMTGHIKSKKISGWAGLWMRVDGEGYEKSLSFDNMKDGKQDRSIVETQPWTLYEIVLDVPSNAKSVSYGALLHGSGQIWFDDMTFEIVNDSVPTTGYKTSYK